MDSFSVTCRSISISNKWLAFLIQSPICHVVYARLSDLVHNLREAEVGGQGVEDVYTQACVRHRAIAVSLSDDKWRVLQAKMAAVHQLLGLATTLLMTNCYIIIC